MIWYGILDKREPISDEEYREKSIGLYLAHPCSPGLPGCQRPEKHTKEEYNKAVKFAEARVAARQKLGIVEFVRELQEELDADNLR